MFTVLLPRAVPRTLLLALSSSEVGSNLTVSCTLRLETITLSRLIASWSDHKFGIKMSISSRC